MSVANSDDVFISVDELAAVLDSGRKTVLLDIRFEPGAPSKRDEYEAGHLPGAHFVDLPTQLAGPRTPGSGNNPLPDPDVLQADLQRWGIDPDSVVAVYGAGNIPPAARAWFVLSWAGIRNVRYLDGGLEAWVASGRPLETGTTPDGAGTVEVVPGAVRTISAEEAARIARDGVLIDARPTKEYLGGETEPGKPARGHIPGAVSAPTRENLDDRGLRRDSEELRARFAALGVDDTTEVGVYCGGGVAATHTALVLRSIGIDAPVFIGSWSAWADDPSRPVATGVEVGKAATR